MLQDAEAAAAGDPKGGAGTVKAVEAVIGKHPLPVDEVGDKAAVFGTAREQG